MPVDPELELKRGYINNILKLMSVIGFIAYVPSMYLSIAEGLWVIAALDTVAYLAVLTITLLKRIPYAAKLVTLHAVTYTLGAALLVFTGPFGAGIIFLFAFVFLTAVFYPVRVTIFANVTALATLCAFTLANSLGVLKWQQHLESMVVLIVNFALVGFIFSHGLSFLMTKLREHIQKQTRMTEELHHRVKNNLQVVSSLISLHHVSHHDAGENSIARLKDRMSALSMVHLLLYADDNVSSLSYQKVLDFIIGKLCTNHQADNIRFIRQIDVPKHMISADRATLLSLVLNEIFCNAFHHAFPDNRPGSVSVRANEEGGMVRIVIQDDGIGFDPLKKTPPGGLGLQIINSLLAQLKAEHFIETKAGTCYVIYIPVE